MEEIMVLFSQPFMNSHFQFLITMISVTSEVLLQWPKISCALMLHSHLSSDVLAWPVPTTQPSAWMPIWPFSNSLHHFPSCCILIKPSLCTSIKWWWILMGKTRFTYNSWITLETKFSMLLPQHINLSPQQHLSWLLHHLLHVNLLQVLSPTEK